MIVSKQHNFVFISQTRCATHTMYEVLQRDYRGQLHRAADGSMHNNQIPERYRDRFTWTIVRNPYSRILSTWYLIRGRPHIPPTFAEFTHSLITKPRKRYDWPCPMHEWLEPIRVDHICRFEDLPRCMWDLPFWHGPERLPKLYTSHTPKQWWLGYTTETATHVRLWAGEDFERYGYHPHFP